MRKRKVWGQEGQGQPLKEGPDSREDDQVRKTQQRKQHTLGNGVACGKGAKIVGPGQTRGVT